MNQKRTIFQVISEHLKAKPITDEDIIQLELKARQMRLKADIEQSKAIIRKAKAESGNRFTL